MAKMPKQMPIRRQENDPREENVMRFVVKPFAVSIFIAVLLAGCATGQGGNSEAAQALSGVLMGIGQGLSGL